MKYISTKEAAEKWGLKERSVRELCQNGRVPNVLRSGRSWMIPDDATRPSIGIARRKEEASEKLHLYLNPTYCENNTLMHISPEEETICKSTELFLRGDFEEAEAIILEMIETCSSPNYLTLGYLTLLTIYRNSKDNEDCIDEVNTRLYELLYENPDFRHTNSLMQLYASKTLDVRMINSLPADLLSLFIYIYLEQKILDSLAGTSSLSYEEIEFLCASLSKDANPCILLYLHISICLYYNLSNETELYMQHLKKATEIALPRKWYTPFATYSYSCAWLEIKEIDEYAYKEIRRLSDIIIHNYISSGYFKSTMPLDFTSPLEIKVAVLLSRGMSNPKIAKTLDISLYKVKETLKMIYAQFGVKNKNELKELVGFHLRM